MIPRGPWLHLLLTMLSAPRLRYILTRLCRRLCTASHLTMPQPLTEFFIGCILSNDPLDRQALPSAHCNAGNASLPRPPGIATLCSPSSASHASDGHEHTAASHVLLQTPPGLEKCACQHASHGTHVKAAPVRPRLCTAISVTPPLSHMSIPPMWEHILCAQQLPTRGVQVPPLVEHTILLVRTLVLFLNHDTLFFLWSNLVNPNPTGSVTLKLLTATPCIINTVSVLQRNPGPARKNPTNIIAAACAKFHAVILQEASDHVPHISDQFLAYTGNTDLAILLNEDTFEPDRMVLAFKEDSTSKSTWGMVLLIVRGLLRRPSLSGTPTVTFCSAHIHNVVAKKRDASTELLQRLHGFMKEHNVDFIGGDFNMSALSTRVLGSNVFSTW